jgi:ribonuclease G
MAFIDCGLDKNCFLEDRKVDDFKINEYIVVQVQKNSTGNKGAKVSTKIKGNLLANLEHDNDIKLIYDANLIEEFLVSKLLKKSTKKIYVNDKAVYERIIKALRDSSFDDIEVLHMNCSNIINEFGLLSKFEKINNKKVWLKSGGFIVIDKTEALWAIDVNSGKRIGKKNEDKEAFVTNTNLEAAKEIMKQIRLKNLGGIIIVDFINMESSEHKEEVISIAKKEARKDNGIVKVYGFTNLGLLEIARKKL